MPSVDRTTRSRSNARSDSNRASSSVATPCLKPSLLMPRPSRGSPPMPPTQDAELSPPPSPVTFNNVFLDAATAFWAPPAPATQPTPRIRAPPKAKVPAGPKKRPTSGTTVRTRNAPDDDFGSEDEGEPNPFAGFPSEMLQKALYSPTGSWKWADGLSIVNPEVLEELGTGAMCSATLKRGLLGDRTITYISRCWLHKKRMFWRGFYSELALYKSSDFLRSLQGDIVPNLIAVCMDPIGTNFIMEPPHPSFWVEASPDMPDVLKERIIAAYETLHSHGVLHGDAELRHMLIGADCKVTIIDFQESRARVPNADLMLYEATPEDFALEMRRVKFKLDFEGARERESAKMQRANEYVERVRSRRPRHFVKGQAIPPDIIEHVELLEEDILEPPVPTDIWNDQWIHAANDPPHRTVIPGQTSNEVRDNVQAFLKILDRMERQKDDLLRVERFFFDTPASSPAPTDPQPPGRTSRKRKASTTNDDSASQPKRPRSSQPGPPDSESSSSATLTTHPHLVTGIIRRPEGFNAMTSYVECGEGELLPASTDRSKTISCRDFTKEPYDGPRAFYVPHPPTENRMAMERMKHCRQSNADDCTKAGLGYNWDGLETCFAPGYKRHITSGTHIAKGALKRRRREIQYQTLGYYETSDDEPPSPPKKARHAGWSRDGHYGRAMERWESKEVLDISRRPDAPRPYSRLPPRLEVPALPPRDAQPARGIMKQRPSVKPLSYNIMDWQDESDVLLSPKTGPPFRQVPRANTRAILHTYVDWAPVPPAPSPQPAPSPPPSPPQGAVRRSSRPSTSRDKDSSRGKEASKGNDAAWSVAFATLMHPTPPTHSSSSSGSAPPSRWTPPTPPTGPSLHRSGSAEPQASSRSAPGGVPPVSRPAAYRRGVSAPARSASFETRYVPQRRTGRKKALPPRDWPDVDANPEADEQEVEAMLCDEDVPAVHVAKPRASFFRTVFGGWWA